MFQQVFENGFLHSLQASFYMISWLILILTYTLKTLSDFEVLKEHV